MSDGYSDMVDYFRSLFDNLLKLLVSYHKNPDQIGILVQLENLQREFKTISNNSIDFDLKLTKDPSFWIMSYRDCLTIPTLEQTMWLLLLQQRLVELAELQKKTKYQDKLLVFVDEKGLVAPNGVHYQNNFWQVRDGDQDILLGIAKKRCQQNPFIGRLTILVAEKNHYRKNSFVLKEVIRVYLI